MFADLTLSYRTYQGDSEKEFVQSACELEARSRMTDFANGARSFVTAMSNELFLNTAGDGNCRYELDDVTVTDQISISGSGSEVCNVLPPHSEGIEKVMFSQVSVCSHFEGGGGYLPWTGGGVPTSDGRGTYLLWRPAGFLLRTVYT